MPKFTSSASTSINIHSGGAPDVGASFGTAAVSSSFASTAHAGFSTAAVGETSNTTQASFSVAGGELPSAGWTLESFTFADLHGSPSTTTIIGAPPDAAGQYFTHNPGDGDQTIAGFDPSTDRLVINGDPAVALAVDAGGAQVHLSDGSTILLSSQSEHPFL